MFRQEEPDALLPGGFELAVWYKTWDADPGDPEHGPAPDVATRPIKWQLIHNEEVIVSAVLYGDHEWNLPFPAPAPADEIDRETPLSAAISNWFRADARIVDYGGNYFHWIGMADRDRIMVMEYLNQNGLI